MVLRIVRFALRAGTEAAFMAHMRQLAERSVGSVPGLLELRVARQAQGEHVVVVGMSLWQDYDSLERFYGDEADRPLLMDPYGEWVESAMVEHLEHVFTARDAVSERH